LCHVARKHHGLEQGAERVAGATAVPIVEELFSARRANSTHASEFSRKAIGQQQAGTVRDRSLPQGHSAEHVLVGQ
jgi:hypothetical protein